MPLQAASISHSPPDRKVLGFLAITQGLVLRGRMQRREFITLLSGAAATWPLAARAQQGEPVRRIGVLMSLGADDKEGQARLAAFLQGLQELGWIDGRNMRVDTRWGAGDGERVRKYIAELVGLAPDVILASGGSLVAPLLQATRTVPIVFTQTPDPVGAGFVESLAHPGGNATGFSIWDYSIGGKWLELLKQTAPGVTRVAVIRDPATPQGIGQFSAVHSLAPSLRVEVVPLNAREPGEIERTISAVAHTPNTGLIVTGSNFAIVHPRTNHQVSQPIQITCGLPAAPLRCRGRANLLWARANRATQACGRLR